MPHKERWKEVPNFDGLEVSDRGNTRINSFKIVKNAGSKQLTERRSPIFQKTNSKGYATICVKHKNGKRKIALVHQLILIAFGSARPRGEEGYHKDNDKMNNRLSNLSWYSRDLKTHGHTHRFSLGVKRLPAAKLRKDQKITHNF